MQLDIHLEELLHQSNLATQEELRHALRTMQVDPDLTLLKVPTDKLIPYSRTLLSQTDKLEVLLMCWAPGMASAPHDHGESYGSVKVLQGQLSNSFWQLKNNILSCLKPSSHCAGDVLSVKSGQIHAMANLSESASYSLHLYVKPIEAMKVYDPEGNRYCTVPDDHGAWWPQDKNAIIHEQNIL